MMFSRPAADAVLIEEYEGLLEWKPNTGLAAPGDLVLLIGPTKPSGFTTVSRLAYRLLQSSDMATTFKVTNVDRRFSLVVLRNASAVVLKTSGTAGRHKAVAGFQKSDRHAGIVAATKIDPNAIVVAPDFVVNGVDIPANVRAYSPPTAADETNNMHCYLYPERARYPDEAPFEIDSNSNDFTCSYAIYELIAG